MVGAFELSRTVLQKTSGYKNVFWEPRRNKWVGVVDIDGTRHFCGANDTELSVAMAVDRMRTVVR